VTGKLIGQAKETITLCVYKLSQMNKAIFANGVVGYKSLGICRKPQFFDRRPQISDSKISIKCSKDSADIT